MGWIKLDDNFFSNRKILNLSKDAKLLHLAGLCYAGANLSDGVIPAGAVRIIAAEADVTSTAKLIRELQSEGLWKAHPTGYEIHDYLKHNTSLAEVEAKREAARERMERKRKAQQAANNDGSSQEVRANNERTSQNVRHPETETETETETEKRRERGADAPARPKSPKGTRLPDDFAVTTEMRAWARSEGATDRLIDSETDKFRDYWPTITGQKGVKANWELTWKNWMRRGIENAPAGLRVIKGNESPYAGRGYDPLRSLPPEELADYERKLAKAKAEAEAMERRGA